MKIEFDLLSNAIDSIQRAIELVAWGDEQGEALRLKQAVQAVAHGVELILKERLKRVHPSLIWENVDKYPSLSARTVTAEGAMSRLISIGGLTFSKSDIDLIRALRATRNAIEHFAWSTTKQEVDHIVSIALAFTVHFTKTHLDYEFLGIAAKTTTHWSRYFKQIRRLQRPSLRETWILHPTTPQLKRLAPSVVPYQ